MGYDEAGELAVGDRAPEAGLHPNKGRSRIVDCRIAPQLPRSAQHVAKAKKLLGAMALEPRPPV
jgi:hypothetical protein